MPYRPSGMGVKAPAKPLSHSPVALCGCELGRVLNCPRIAVISNQRGQADVRVSKPDTAVV